MHPFKLVSRQLRHTRTVVNVSGVRIGDGEVVVMAGHCSVESREQLMETARAVRRAGAQMLRGGASKRRTSAYDFQGLGREALALLKEASIDPGLPVVTEVMSETDVEIVVEYADMLQIGARNMQNFSLLRRVAQTNRPVMGRICRLLHSDAIIIPLASQILKAAVSSAPHNRGHRDDFQG